MTDQTNTVPNDWSESSATILRLQEAEIRLLFTQFILFAQNRNLWLFERRPGDAARPLTTDEIMSLKLHFADAWKRGLDPF